MDKLLKVVTEQNEEAESSFQLKRIADAMEEILRLVKKDMANIQKSVAEESEKKEVEGDSQAMNAFGD